jgi:hypothetical protein
VEDKETEAGRLEHLAYELSLRALERQERVLDELRGRTGTMLAASSVAASFLGARVAETDTGALTVSAVAMFVLSIGVGTYVLLPKSGLIFALRGSVLFEREFEDAVAIGETHRRLAYWIESYYDANQQLVDRLFLFFRAATIAVLLQVVLWILEIVV